MLFWFDIYDSDDIKYGYRLDIAEPDFSEYIYFFLILLKMISTPLVLKVN